MTEHSSQHGVYIIIATVVGLMVLERLFPLRLWKRNQSPRLIVNAALSLLTFATSALLVRPAALATLDWGKQHSFGLLRLGVSSFWVEFVVGFLLLDLTFYYWHRLSHRLPILWRFHNVHHVDPDLDTSTGFRFHFGEVALSALFRSAQAALLGVSLSTYIIYEFVFQIGVYFHHSNWRLHPNLERSLNYLFVTPRMHGMHHSQKQDETDSNYSVIFSIWDRIHRTMSAERPQSEIVIGVPGYSKIEDNRLWNVLLSPFRRLRI